MARTITKPTRSYGGKSSLTSLLLSLLPAHHECYVEPYFGSGTLYFAKPPSAVEVINDRDQAVVSFFRVLRDPVRAARLMELLRLTPYARLEWEECRAGLSARWQAWTTDEVELARRFYVGICQAYGAHLVNTSWSSTKLAGHNPAVTWRAAIEALPRFTERLRDAQIEYGDALDVIARYDGPDTVMYLDPPYVADVRASGAQRRYTVEMMGAVEHRRLLRLLTRANLRGMVLLSSYDGCDLYDRTLTRAGWRCVRADVRVASSAARRQATECVWCNPALSARLASERDERAAAARRRTPSLWGESDPGEGDGESEGDGETMEARAVSA